MYLVTRERVDARINDTVVYATFTNIYMESTYNLKIFREIFRIIIPTFMINHSSRDGMSFFAGITAL